MNTKIKTVLGIVIIIILVTTVGVFVWQGREKIQQAVQPQTKSQEEISRDKIVVYQNGTSYSIDNKASYFKELQKEIEEFLATSDNGIWEAILHETISKIKEEKAVEIIYETSHKLAINNPTYSPKFIKVNRLLIPMEGYYYPKTIIWGNGKDYSSGPFLNSKGAEKTERIMKIIMNKGVEKNETSSWQTYRNEKYGFEVKFPADLTMQKRSAVEPEIYWDGKLNGIPYVMTLGYISQDTLNTMGVTYCGANPEDTRCENFKWGNLAATIDWNIETEGTFTESRAEIKHPNSGVIIIGVDHRPAQDIKPFFRQILSTFKFLN